MSKAARTLFVCLVLDDGERVIRGYGSVPKEVVAATCDSPQKRVDHQVIVAIQEYHDDYKAVNSDSL